MVRTQIGGIGQTFGIVKLVLRTEEIDGSEEGWEDEVTRGAPECVKGGEKNTSFVGRVVKN